MEISSTLSSNSLSNSPKVKVPFAGSSLITIAEKQLGGLGTVEGRQNAAEIARYFSEGPLNPEKECFQAGSADCWINAREYYELKNNPGKLQKLVEFLLTNRDPRTNEFFLKASDFQGEDEFANPDAGARRGCSLALDRCFRRMFNSPFGSDDYVLEAFESLMRGEEVVAFCNGVDSDGKDNSKKFDSYFSKPERMIGLSFSLKWLQPSARAALAANNPDLLKDQYHIGVGLEIDVKKIENGRIYFYQSWGKPRVEGPRRREEAKGMNSMTLEEFRSICRSAYIPRRELEAASREDGITYSRSVDALNLTYGFEHQLLLDDRYTGAKTKSRSATVVVGSRETTSTDKSSLWKKVGQQEYKPSEQKFKTLSDEAKQRLDKIHWDAIYSGKDLVKFRKRLEKILEEMASHAELKLKRTLV